MKSPKATVIQYGERQWTLDAAEFKRLPEDCILREIRASCNDGEALVLPDIGDATPDQFDTELGILLGRQQGITRADVDHLYRRLDWWKISAATPLPHVPIEVRLRIAARAAQAQNEQQALEELRIRQLLKLVQHALEHDMKGMRAPNVTAILIRKAEEDEPLLWFRPFLRSIAYAEDVILDTWKQLCGSNGVPGILVRSAADDSSQAFTLEQVTLHQHGLIRDASGELNNKLDEVATVWTNNEPNSWKEHVRECLKQDLQRSLRGSFTGGEKLLVEVVDPCSAMGQPTSVVLKGCPFRKSFFQWIHMMVRVSSSMH